MLDVDADAFADLFSSGEKSLTVECRLEYLDVI
jgi:hypothetical protein